jgi:hypothetical protein
VRSSPAGDAGGVIPEGLTMRTDLQQQKLNTEAAIRAKLVELIRLCAGHGINFARLAREAIDYCDPEGPYSR